MQCRSPSPMSRPRPGSARPRCRACSTARASSTRAPPTRVRQVIDELGYVPSARAVGLARGRTRVVGMLVPSLTWPWMGEVLQGVVDVVESEGYGLLLFTCNRGEESMQQFASQVSAKSFDGLLVIEPEGTLDYIARTARARPAGRADRRPRPPARSSRRSPPPTATAAQSRRPAPARARPPPAAGDHRRRTVRLHPGTPGRLRRRSTPTAGYRARPETRRSTATSPSTSGRDGVQHALDAATRRSTRLRAQRSVRGRRHPGAVRETGLGTCRTTWRWSGSTTSRSPHTPSRR